MMPFAPMTTRAMRSLFTAGIASPMRRLSPTQA